MFAFIAISFWKALGHAVHWTGAWDWMHHINETSSADIYSTAIFL